MATYNINIVNGVGTEEVLNGTYDVTANVTGYDNSTITPASVTVSDSVDEYSFTIAATGTLTLHVTEDGTAAGVPITSGSFIRTDALGNEYGSAVSIDAQGDAVFENVPFDSTGAVTVHYKQTASDGLHNFDDTVKSINLTSSTTTEQVQNSGPEEKTFRLLDANYENLEIATGTLTLTE